MNAGLIFSAFMRHVELCVISVGLGTLTAVSNAAAIIFFIVPLPPSAPLHARRIV